MEGEHSLFLGGGGGDGHLLTSQLRPSRPRLSIDAGWQALRWLSESNLYIHHVTFPLARWPCGSNRARSKNRAYISDFCGLPRTDRQGNPSSDVNIWPRRWTFPTQLMSFARLWTKMANISVTVVQIEQLIELVRENPGLYDPAVASLPLHSFEVWSSRHGSDLAELK